MYAWNTPGRPRPEYRSPWGLAEMRIEDRDRIRIVLVEVPPGRPLRRDPRPSRPPRQTTTPRHERAFPVRQPAHTDTLRRCVADDTTVPLMTARAIRLCGIAHITDRSEVYADLANLCVYAANTGRFTHVRCSAFEHTPFLTA